SGGRRSHSADRPARRGHGLIRGAHAASLARVPARDRELGWRAAAHRAGAAPGPRIRPRASLAGRGGVSPRAVAHPRMAVPPEHDRRRDRLHGVGDRDRAGAAAGRTAGHCLSNRCAGRECAARAPALASRFRGLLAFQKAERLFADARWGEARSAYAAAAALDTACWLCYLRHAEVGRWLDLEDDPADNIHDLAHVDAFPLHYQRLIRAQQLPVAARLDSLDALTRRWKDFLFGQFRRGAELLHRGPLVGRSRREALAPFEEVLKFQPAFGPALEHVAWVHVAEGDSAGAAAALTQRERLGSPSDPRSFATLALVELAYAWRFLPPADAERRTDALIRLARAAGVVQLDAGARYLPAFGVPHGALAFAERLLHEPGFERSASIARVLALVGLGRPDTAVALARRLAGRFPDLAIFADELSAAMLVFDSDSARFAVELPAVRARLNGD